MESYLPLFLLLAMLLLVAWQILLDFIPISISSDRHGYRGLSASYHKKYAAEISGGRMPDSIRQHLLDILYRRRFDGLLITTVLLSLAFLFWVSPWAVGQFEIDKSSQAAAALYVAVLGLPIFTFVWFIRSYERDRELTREEADLWSVEFDRLMKAAASADNEVLRRAAVRQLQDYLSGAKWRTNQRSNSTAIFELFSSIVDERRRNLEEVLGTLDEKEQEDDKMKVRRAQAVSQVRQEPILLTIGAVLRSVFGGDQDIPSRVRVSQNSLSNFHFDLLDLKGINFSKLNIAHGTFAFANLSNANLSEANLDGADFTEAGLHEADLSDASLDGASLADAGLVGANLSGAKMRWGDLSRAYLPMAVLSGANLTGSDLLEAELSDANLFGVNLFRANLSGAHLSQTTLHEVNLSMANLEHTGLNKVQTLERFPGISYDEETKWDTAEVDIQKS